MFDAGHRLVGGVVDLAAGLVQSMEDRGWERGVPMGIAVTGALITFGVLLFLGLIG